METNSLFLLFIYFGCSWAFKPGQLLKSYTVNSYKSMFSLKFNDHMIPIFEGGSAATLRLVGQLEGVTEVALTTSTSDCVDLQESTISNIIRISEEEASVTLVMPNLAIRKSSLYFCLSTTNQTWVHQGSEDWSRVLVSRGILSMSLVIILIIACLILSGTLSGLILGLMSWDLADLRVVANARGRKERNYGRVILSVRKQGNYLLVSLVMGATTLNSMFTVLVNMFVSEWLTVVCVTLAIVSCCEIIPDLIMSRYALIVGTITICFTWTVMIITSPLSYPLGKLLDKLMEGDVWSVTRDRLRDVAKGLLTDQEENRESNRQPGHWMRLQRRNIPNMPEGIISEMSTGGDEGPNRKSYYRGIQRPRGRFSGTDPSSSASTEMSKEPQSDSEGGYNDGSLYNNSESAPGGASFPKFKNEKENQEGCSHVTGVSTLPVYTISGYVNKVV